MSDGIDRDFFDAIMTEFKSRYGVEQKLDFSADQMREIAIAYKLRAQEQGVVFVDDPFEQVVSCILKVLASWDSPHPRLYRQYIGIAEEWGTAVVVQRMVFGNLSRGSGSGVTFTSNPLEPYSRQVRLFGDFAVCSQGEDLVGGLVFPLPISEAQRLGSPTYRGTGTRWSGTTPRSTRAPRCRATTLSASASSTRRRSSSPSSRRRPADLYVLQKRAVVQEQRRGRRLLRYVVARLRRLPWPWAWAWPAAPTPGGRPSTPRRSISCWPTRPTRTSCCCAPTRCPRTSP